MSASTYLLQDLLADDASKAVFISELSIDDLPANVQAAFTHLEELVPSGECVPCDEVEG